MNQIDGKRIASELLDSLSTTIQKAKIEIGLVFFLVGNDPASLAYVRMKKKACSKIGIQSLVKQYPEDVEESVVLKDLLSCNNDPNIHGILVQLPLPKQFNTQKVIRSISPTKDVDGFHPVNLGKLLLGEEDGFYPCTPLGVKILLEKTVPIEGKHVVIVGRSNIVGKPLAALLSQKKNGCNATVTLAHSRSEHLNQITKSADILIAAIGKPHFIQKEMIKPQAVIIDVGINREKTESTQTRLIGDVDFEQVAPIASWITPVPGGVGPMTVAMLMHNTVKSALKSRENNV